MFWSIYIFLAAAALPAQFIDGNDSVVSSARRLRASNSAHLTLKEMISTLQKGRTTNVDVEGPDRLRAMLETLEAVAADTVMSFNPTSQPTCDHSAPPSASLTEPPLVSPLTSEFPSSTPSNIPSSSPIDVPTVDTTKAPTASPVIALSAEPSTVPSSAPAVTPTAVVTSPPTNGPVAPPVTVPVPQPVTSAPVVAPVVPPVTLVPVTTAPVTSAPVVTLAPVVVPVTPPVTMAPALVSGPAIISPICPGITNEERILQILAILDAVADDDDIRNNETPQGLATTWIIEQDIFQVCPDYIKLVQRWTLAVMYFSTSGNEWFQCSANTEATDLCGIQSPFEGDERFLSNTTECEWAGITCIDGCVTEIEFEQNNLVGTIPTEMGLLSMLTIWGMERGRLSSTIPTEIVKLTNLIFLDLDFNELTGSITSELLSLSSLTQLDLNDNLLTGSINGIGVYPNMTFLQLHGNAFTGTVPESIGTFTNLGAFTLHESNISGTMPTSVCNLRPSSNSGGKLTSLIADCSQPNPNIVCDCCTDCRRPLVGGL